MLLSWSAPSSVGALVTMKLVTSLRPVARPLQTTSEVRKSTAWMVVVMSTVRLLTPRMLVEVDLMSVMMPTKRRSAKASLSKMRMRLELRMSVVRFAAIFAPVSA
ncbi:MAG: hypothetical protein HC933_10230 [Pleurocapsa sp. SU_196_0]|nr:hypothetical protein [Pleurocapsa sp. SU_196_0]